MTLKSKNDVGSTSIDIRNEPYGWNNEHPSEDTRQLAIDARSVYCADLRETKRIIKALNITLDAFRKHVRNTNQRILICNQILSPIRRLPDDLLGEIDIKEPLLPSLTSFAVRGFCDYGTSDTLELLVQFCTRRVCFVDGRSSHFGQIDDNAEKPAYEALESVDLEIDSPLRCPTTGEPLTLGHIDALNHNDVATRIVRHAESVGRSIGKGLFVRVARPTRGASWPFVEG